MKIIIVGAGLAGLTAGLYLKGYGHDVTIIEKNNSVGGRSGGRKYYGLEYDSGATVLTMPNLITDAIKFSGANHEINFIPINPTYTGRFADKSIISLPHEKTNLFEYLSHIELKENIEKHYENVQKIFDNAFNDFMYLDVSKFSNFLNLKLFKKFFYLIKLGSFGNLQKLVENNIKDKRLQRLFTFQALYAGLSPMKARGIYSLISYMDVFKGVYYPENGIRSIGEIMADAFKSVGGKIYLNNEITGCIIQNHLVKSVTNHAGEHFHADKIIFAVDSPIIEKILNRKTRRFNRKESYSPSAVVGHILVNRKNTRSWPTQSHHVLDFGSEWEKTFNQINAKKNRGSLMSDPSFLITRAEITKANTNNKNEEFVSVLAPCPNLESLDFDWAEKGEEYFKSCLHVLEDRGYYGISTSKLISLDTPLTWKNDGLAVGTPFSAAHSLAQTGPFRRSCRINGIKNAFIAGAGTHPGVGIPTVIISGKLIAEIIGKV